MDSERDEHLDSYPNFKIISFFSIVKNLVMDQAGCLEDTPLLPQRVKSGSILGFALLSLRSRNHARSAFHTVFSTPSLILFIPQIG
jgi:hypothetical protein